MRRWRVRLFGCLGILGAVVASAAPTSAEWSDEALALARSYSEEPFAAAELMDDPWIATAWGALKARRFFKFGGVSEARVPSKYFEKGYLRVVFRPYPGPAPLIVFAPGIFNNLKDPTCQRAVKTFARRGYHVVVVPNSWGVDYASHRPRFLPGDFQAEARVLLAVIRNVRDRLGPRQIESINIVGESYGAVLSAVAAALDAESKAPLIDGNVTLFSPPVDVRLSLPLMDQLLDANEDTYREHCRKRGMWAVLDVIRAKVMEDIRPRTKECVESLLVFEGFHKWLKALARGLVKHKLVDPALAERYDSRALQTIRFTTFERDFTPANYERILEGEGSLPYWVSRAERAGFTRIRILAAMNDFLNKPWQWEELAGLGSRRLLLLPTGGHLGYIGLPWFQTMLAASYPARQTFVPKNSVLLDEGREEEASFEAPLEMAELKP